MTFDDLFAGNEGQATEIPQIKMNSTKTVFQREEIFDIGFKYELVGMGQHDLISKRR